LQEALRLCEEKEVLSRAIYLPPEAAGRPESWTSEAAATLAAASLEAGLRPEPELPVAFSQQEVELAQEP
jgi:hypothetical protein